MVCVVMVCVVMWSGGRGRRGEEDLVPFQYNEQASKLVVSKSNLHSDLSGKIHILPDY